MRVIPSNDENEVYHIIHRRSFLLDIRNYMKIQRIEKQNGKLGY